MTWVAERFNSQDLKNIEEGKKKSPVQSNSVNDTTPVQEHFSEAKPHMKDLDVCMCVCP